VKKWWKLHSCFFGKKFQFTQLLSRKDSLCGNLGEEVCCVGVIKLSADKDHYLRSPNILFCAVFQLSSWFPMLIMAHTKGRSAIFHQWTPPNKWIFLIRKKLASNCRRAIARRLCDRVLTGLQSDSRAQAVGIYVSLSEAFATDCCYADSSPDSWGFKCVPSLREWRLLCSSSCTPLVSVALVWAQRVLFKLVQCSLIYPSRAAVSWRC